MMLQAYRLVRREYAATAFSGEGARLYGGRWNPPGVSMVYTADSIALATLELLVHLPALPLHRYCLITVQFDESLVERVSRKSLPARWYRYGNPHSTRQFGATWFQEQRSVVLAVPSAVIHEHVNYLLNPHHPRFREVVIGKPRAYRMDSRLFD